jgi:hypothetical protein
MCVLFCLCAFVCVRVCIDDFSLLYVSAYVCMYVCMYVLSFVSMYLCMYVINAYSICVGSVLHMHACMIRRYVCTHVHIRMHTIIQVCMQARMHSRTCVQRRHMQNKCNSHANTNMRRFFHYVYMQSPNRHPRSERTSPNRTKHENKSFLHTLASIILQASSAISISFISTHVCKNLLKYRILAGVACS